MILKELVFNLDSIFHKDLAAQWDMVGLQAGTGKKEVKKALITIDVDDELIEEALRIKADLIISHHPLIFQRLGSVTDSTSTGRKLLKLIENKIAVYSAHTNYDIMEKGLNDVIAGRLGLVDVRPVSAYQEKLFKFVVFVPVGSQEAVRKAICSSGGGRLGDYSCCTFSSRGRGTFLPGKEAHPYTGRTGELNIVDEIRMECIVRERDLDRLVGAVLKAHPYEEPAYDIFRMENSIKSGGLGRIGKLEDPVTFKDFLNILRKRLEVRDIGWLHRGMENTASRVVERIAVAAGSANSLTRELEELECDVVVAGEMNYHNGIRISESGKIAVALGHGSIEKFAIDGIYDLLSDFMGKNRMDVEVIKSTSGYWTWRYDIGRL